MVIETYKVKHKIVSIAFFFFAAFSNSASGVETIPVPAPSERKEIKAQETNEKTPIKPRVYQAACPAFMNGSIIAKVLPEISNDQCGDRSPLEVESILGVSLNSNAVLNCRMATSLVGWIEKAKKDATVIMSDELQSITTSTSYDCRKRRNGKQGKLSEHSFANALDITGFKLKNGTSISLLEHWDNSARDEGNEDMSTKEKAKFLLLARDAACTHFTTVLSPNSNEDHKDHFHFDLGCHGKKCTYKICE